MFTAAYLALMLPEEQQYAHPRRESRTGRVIVCAVDLKSVQTEIFSAQVCDDSDPCSEMNRTKSFQTRV